MSLTSSLQICFMSWRRHPVAWRLSVMVVWTLAVVLALWLVPTSTSVLSATPVWAYWLVAHITPLIYVLLLLMPHEPSNEQDALLATPTDLQAQR
jgi:hypothetical protein